MPKHFKEKVNIVSKQDGKSGLYFERLKAATDDILTLGVSTAGEVVEQDQSFKEKEFDVNKASHGFAALDPIYFDGEWKKADSSNLATHIVGEVTDDNNFVAYGPVPQEATAHGFTLGSTVYQVDGNLTTTKPTGCKKHCVGKAYTTNEIIFWEHIECRKRICKDEGQVGVPQASAYKTMTIHINESYGTADDSKITYHDDAVNLEPGLSEWDDFIGHRPCLFKDGQVVKYLNPSNYHEDIDGNCVDITSGKEGDVMIEFPRRGIKWDTMTIDYGGAGKRIVLSVTNEDDKEGYSYKAFTKDGAKKDKFYVAAYQGYKDADGKLRSLSGKKVTNTSATIDKFRQWAEANGTDYSMVAWYQWMYIQILFALKYKSVHPRVAVGYGACKSGATDIPFNTGKGDKKGLDWGTTDEETIVKFLGIENVWGNGSCYLDGIITDDSGNILVSDHDFNSDGTGYTDTGIDAPEGWGYTKNIYGTDDLGFFGKTTNSTENPNINYYRAWSGGYKGKKHMRTGGGYGNGYKTSFYTMHFDATGSSSLSNYYYTRLQHI